MDGGFPPLEQSLKLLARKASCGVTPASKHTTWKHMQTQQKLNLWIIWHLFLATAFLVSYQILQTVKVLVAVVTQVHVNTP